MSRVAKTAKTDRVSKMARNAEMAIKLKWPNGPNF